MANIGRRNNEPLQDEYALQSYPARASEDSWCSQDHDSSPHLSHSTTPSPTADLLVDLEFARTTCSDINREDIFDPIDPPLGYPPLDYRPFSLEPWFLILTLIFLAGCEAGVITLIVLSRISPQHLHFQNSKYRWLIKYSPAVIGTVTMIWFRTVAASYNRISPYVRMASVLIPSKKRRRPLRFKDMCGINLMSTPDWKLQDSLKYKYWVAFAVRLTFISSGLLLVPAKAGLLDVTEDSSNVGWTVNVSLILGAATAILYVLLLLSVLSILISLKNVSTGLKWEPASIASQLSILHMFDFQNAFDGLDFALESHMRAKIRSWTYRFGVLRLGYWKHRETGTVIYCLRFMRGQDCIEPSNDCKVITHSENSVKSKWRSTTAYSDTEAPLNCEGHYLANPELCKIGNLPVFLRDAWISALSLIGLLGVTACITTLALGLNNKVLRVPASLKDYVKFGDGVKLSVVLNFLTAFLYNLYSLTFILADARFRSMQSIHDMETPQLGKESILLDYISPDPFTVLAIALRKSHWRIAWHTFLASTCQITPILAGHIFTRRRQGITRALFVNPPTFYISVAIMCVYCIALPFARLPAGYRTPRPLNTVFDIILYCYHSHLPLLPEFEVQDPNDKQEHLKAKVILARHQYQFGLYRCIGGERRHLGISPVRIKYGDTFIQQVDRIIVDSEWYRFQNHWFRPPRVERAPQFVLPSANNDTLTSKSFERRRSENAGGRPTETASDEDEQRSPRRSQRGPDSGSVASFARTVRFRDSIQSGASSQQSFQTAVEPRDPKVGIARRRTGDFEHPLSRF